jgi:hypothetical protein
VTALESFEKAMRELRFDADLYVDDEGRIKVHILRQGNTYALGRGQSLEEAMVHALSEMGRLNGQP